MTVLEKIKNITDRGLFEKICVDILRIIRPEYSNIIHGGLNEKGEPVPSPLDAFHNYDDGNFVLVEVTSDDSNLRKKWLDKENGDLFKAFGKVKSWRESFPDAKFTLWLCTNQRIKDSHQNKLFTDVNKLCVEMDLAIEFLEQSAIVSFLENSPVGQWIAQESLGIQASQLSIPKLFNLASINLEEYAREIYLDELIIRPCEQDIRDLLLHASAPVMLVAKSGVGKSTMGYRLIQRWLESGKWALRIKHDVAATAISLTHAINKQLLQYQGNLFLDANQILSFKEKPLIVIDDLNKSLNPAILLESILLWQRETNLTVLIPVWQNVYDQLPARFKERNSTDKNKPKMSESFFLEKYTTEESKDILRLLLGSNTSNFSDQQLERMSEELSYDPFLVRTYGELSAIDQNNWLGKTTEPIKEYIREKLLAVQLLTTAPYYRLEDTLLLLMDCMLQQKMQYFSFRALGSELDKDQIKILEGIGSSSSIFSIDTEGHIVFKHDKVRDYLLSQSISRMLNDIPKNSAVLSEPYYAEIIGKALTRTNGKLLEDSCNWLLNVSPLAVVESLNYIQDENTNEFITQKIIAWYKEKKAATNEAILTSMKISLSNTYNPKVIRICEHLETDFSILYANFLNGHTVSGIRYISMFAREDFEPSSGNVRRDYILGNFNIRFRNKGISDVKAQLNLLEYTTDQKKAIIMFAGYLRSEELFDAVFEAWKSAKETLLLNTIWTLILSFKSGDELKLQEVFDFWAGLPAGENTNGFPKGTKDLCTFYLAHYKNYACNDGLVKFLLKNAANESYLNLAWAIMVYLDHPDVLEFAVRRFAKIKKQLAEKEGFYMTSLTISNFPERWSPRHDGGKNLSVISRTKLRELWKAPENDAYLRFQAFTLWSVGANQKDEAVLLEIEASDEEIYNQALLLRMLIEDRSVLKEVKQVVMLGRKESEKYLEHLCFIWSPEVLDYIDKLLTSYIPLKEEEFKYPNSWVLSGIEELLRYCPDNDVSYLLEKHWSKLGKMSNFIILALLTGTKKTAELVAQVFPLYPYPRELFKYMGIHLTSGKIVNLIRFQRKPMTSQVLHNLRPYLPHFDHNVLDDLMRSASTEDQRSFIFTNVLPLLKKKPGRYDYARELFPMDSDICVEFNKFVREPKRRWQIESWLERMEKNGIKRKRLVSVILAEVKKRPIDKARAECFSKVIEFIGERSDLKHLDQVDENRRYHELWIGLEYRLKRKLLN
jgi:hypothetical protein